MEFLLVTTELESSLIELKSSLIQFLLKSNQIKSNHFYCHITTAQVPW